MIESMMIVFLLRKHREEYRNALKTFIVQESYPTYGFIKVIYVKVRHQNDDIAQ